MIEAGPYNVSVLAGTELSEADGLIVSKVTFAEIALLTSICPDLLIISHQSCRLTGSLVGWPDAQIQPGALALQAEASESR